MTANNLSFDFMMISFLCGATVEEDCVEKWRADRYASETIIKTVPRRGYKARLKTYSMS